MKDHESGGLLKQHLGTSLIRSAAWELWPEFGESKKCISTSKFFQATPFASAPERLRFWVRDFRAGSWIVGVD